MATMQTIQHAFQDGVVVFDGAMGTEIYKRNVLTSQCFDELCLLEPDLIREIHGAYCNAGADVLYPPHATDSHEYPRRLHWDQGLSRGRYRGHARWRMGICGRGYD